MSARRKIDETDKGILAALGEDPQASNTSIAVRLNLSEITVANRIEAMIADKIMKITVQRDMRTLGYEVFGFVEIWVEGKRANEVTDKLRDIPQVFSLSILIGQPQIMVMLMARDLNEFLLLVERRIGDLPGVARAATSIVLDVIDFKPGIAAIS